MKYNFVSKRKDEVMTLRKKKMLKREEGETNLCIYII